jgi:uncharacterized protein YdaU (DUF1376 family)
MADKANGIWMPIFIGDYLSDTMHLTTEQHGAYFLLMLAYWKNRGPLPENKIKPITKLSEDSWSIDSLTLKEFFDTESQPGKWVHHRIEKELQKASENHKNAVKRGKAGAQKRYGKKYTTQKPGGDETPFDR